jgi:hypothetical protein
MKRNNFENVVDINDYRSSNNEKKNKKHIGKRAAAIALAATITVGAGLYSKDKGYFYNPVNKNSGPKVEAQMGKSDNSVNFDFAEMSPTEYDSKTMKPLEYTTDNGATIDVCSVDKGDQLVLSKEAAIRTEPVIFGQGDGEKSSIVITKENIKLPKVKDYYFYYEGSSSSMGNSFYGIKVSDIESTFPNVNLKDSDKDQIVWVNSNEIATEEISKK